MAWTDINMDAYSGTATDGITSAESTSDSAGSLGSSTDSVSTSNYKGVKQWDVRDIACTVGGILLDDFIGIDFDNERPVSHIETVKEVVGYNLSYPKPTYALHIRMTSDGLPGLYEMKNRDELIDIVFTAPSYMLTIMGAIIGSIKPGTIGQEAPEVVVSGLAMRIEEYIQTSHWITQQDSLTANQNTLYGMSGLSNGLENESDYPWVRRDSITTS